MPSDAHRTSEDSVLEGPDDRADGAQRSHDQRHRETTGTREMVADPVESAERDRPCNQSIIIIRRIRKSQETRKREKENKAEENERKSGAKFSTVRPYEPTRAKRNTRDIDVNEKKKGRREKGTKKGEKKIRCTGNRIRPCHLQFVEDVTRSKQFA